MVVKPVVVGLNSLLDPNLFFPHRTIEGLHHYFRRFETRQVLILPDFSFHILRVRHSKLFGYRLPSFCIRRNQFGYQTYFMAVMIFFGPLSTQF